MSLIICESQRIITPTIMAGFAELAKLVKIDKFYDHGPLASLDEDKSFATKYAAYQSVTNGKSITLKPGSTIENSEEGLPVHHRFH